MTAPPPDADPHTVNGWLMRGEAVLIDVREPDEFAAERLSSASLNPLSRFNPADVAAIAGSNRHVVVYCRAGRRGAEAARLLAAARIPATNLTGGLNAWKSAGLPIVASDKPMPLSIMRQVQLTIGFGVLCGVGLAWLVSSWFLIVPAFFGLGLVLAGATGNCGLASLVAHMPWNKTQPSSEAGHEHE